MLTIIVLFSPLVAATATAIVERTRRTTKLKVLAALPPGSEIVEQRGDRSWWHIRVAPACTVHLITIEGGVHDRGIA